MKTVQGSPGHRPCWLCSYLLSLKLVGSDDVCHGHHFVSVHGKEVLGNVLESTGDKEGDLLPQKEGPVRNAPKALILWDDLALPP